MPVVVKTSGFHQIFLIQNSKLCLHKEYLVVEMNLAIKIPNDVKRLMRVIKSQGSQGLDGLRGEAEGQRPDARVRVAAPREERRAAPQHRRGGEAHLLLDGTRVLGWTGREQYF